MPEAQGSSQIYPLLKREDEKFVTEQAYQNPKFVEDVLRDVVAVLRANPRVVFGYPLPAAQRCAAIVSSARINLRKLGHRVIIHA